MWGENEMGMYCACGERISRETFDCKCNWDGWNRCYDDEIHPKISEIKLPEKDGIYHVRIFSDGDCYEDESKFSVVPKNWGQKTNEIISHWEIEYDDGWVGYRGVYAWREK